MNKLKRLFSPRNIATTMATGMLVLGTVNVLADHQTSACLWTNSGCPTCGSDTICGPASFNGGLYYWCCGSPDVRCGGYTPSGYPGCSLAYGCGTCLQ